MHNMMTDRNAAFDFVTVFAPILLILATCLTVFYRLRARWPVKVNCWFCNENVKIWRQDLNWWLCPWCEQYNGFSKDGDYAYDIPEQYAMPKVRTKYCRLSRSSDNCHINLKDKLCTYCNERESQKLLELSSFEPRSEKLFHTELKAFKEHLEVRYPLCDGCKLMVRDVLHKQALWLTRYKMLFFRQKSIKTLLSNPGQQETLCRLISTVMVVLALDDFVWLPIGGLLFRLCICASFKMRNKSIHVVWIFLLVYITYDVSMSVKSLTTQNVWLIPVELVTQYRLIVVCAFVIDLFIYLMRNSNLYKSALKMHGSVAFKRIKLHSRDTPQHAYKSQNSSESSETIDSIKPSIYSADELSSTEIKFSRSHSAILRQKLSTITATDNGSNGYLSSASSRRENRSLDSCCLNDSLSTLLLSEDAPLPRYGRSTRAAPAIFERRVYNATSSENLFRKSISKRKCILSPPKLRSVTQTSWVAGGYWQEGMMTAAATPPTLSRSSSQSSGFGSSVGSSNLAPPSREPSVHEFDRCSVVSEATRWSCQTPPPRPIVSRPDSSISQSRYSDATCNADNRNWVPPLVHAVGPHTTTIVASPGWLSAMLCGSLILNMIVLCATLLR
ncbi:transmembrane protein 201 homolog [Monomorium pharaonis]|uniref:transmembrane protein 201 homolog n=1 Tax=Monomorium pharaonis TaxID=307658 RepID=UPI0017466225|nr:transmembrane protein 201 homolog [Monomorium pharaonis]